MNECQLDEERLRKREEALQKVEDAWRESMKQQTRLDEGCYWKRPCPAHE
jgi:flagellin-specific chaperone FliS